MKRYIALTFLGLAFSGAAFAKQCDATCRQNCLDTDQGDQCISQCGCETLSDGITREFADQ